MSGRSLNAQDFAKAVRLTIPKNIRSRGRKVFLIVATDVHRELTLGTHVDSGFLRASLAAATNGVPFPSPAVKLTKPTPKRMQFAPLWPGAQAQAVSAIANAVKGLTPLVFAYGASYAKYPITGTPQLVARVRRMVPQFVRGAVTRVQATASEAAD